MSEYIGRFAPSPTGPLHAGSLACMLASYLDAKAHYGKWFIRIEDIDPAREPDHCAEKQLEVLEKLQVRSDFEIIFQSQRTKYYESVLNRLRDKALVYGCCCSRKTIAEQDELLHLKKGVYPGTCRNGTHGKAIRSWRMRTVSEPISFDDRICGFFSQNIELDVGDFILKRADGLWAYQLAVVTDDAAQGVSHIVRGQDLLDNTPRQIHLQRSLNFPTPVYMHIPLVLGENGEKLSKQNKAEAINEGDLEGELIKAWEHLGFSYFPFDSLQDFYKEAIRRWRKKYG